MKIAMQAYSVRHVLRAMPLETLRAIADTGCRYIELWNDSGAEKPGTFFGLSVGELRPVLTSTGLRIIGSHFSFADLDDIDEAVEFQLAIGNFRIGITEGIFNSLDDVKRAAERLNALAVKLRRYGIQLYYHNGFQEFREFDGKPALYHLADLTEPRNVSFELDTYWCRRGGRSPFKVMDYLDRRIELIHQKDFSDKADEPLNYLGGVLPENARITPEILAAASESAGCIEIGNGILPIQSYIDRANELGAEYFVVEQDNTKLGEITSLQMSVEAAKRYNGLELR